MKDIKDYDILMISTPADYARTQPLHRRLVEYLPSDSIKLISSQPAMEIIEADGYDEIEFVDENSIIKFDDVWQVVLDHLKDLLNGQELPRGQVGWYYQQFLKLGYAEICQREYYMTWDGDTVPAKAFSMFAEDGRPYFDLKHEYCQEYFDTMERILPGVHKVIERSFISEHMLFKKSIVLNMLEDIENNEKLVGNTWWEKIVRSIPPEEYVKGVFSEFETYGSYVALRYTGEYKLRSWNSFRNAGFFLHPEAMEEKDWTWLARDFYALSFEKKAVVREDYENIFNNPRYQEKLSARQVLELCQEEMEEGYKEVWD